MSAGHSGRLLLDGVREESLDEILRAVRELHQQQQRQPPDHFGIHPLDRLCRAHFDSKRSTSSEEHHSSTLSYSTQPGARTQAAIRSISRRRPAVIELISQREGAGKTQLLYLITALAVLPASSDGRGKAIVIIDADNRFNVNRLVQVMQTHLEAHDSTDDTDAHATYTDQTQQICPSSEKIKSALDHVHILRPTSHSELLSSLDDLSIYLLDHSAHRSSFRQLHSIIIDSVLTFSWELRADAATAKSSERPETSSLPQILTALQDRFECAVITTFCRYTTEPVAGIASAIAVLRPLRLLLSRRFTPRFPAGLSVRDAMGVRGRMERAEGKDVFDVKVVGAADRSAPASVAGPGIREDLGFSFKVQEEGVFVEGIRGISHGPVIDT